MTINNGSIIAVEKGTQAFDRVYHANDLVFNRWITAGTVLWQEDGKYGNQTVTLSQPISKLENGIKISFGSKVRMTAINKSFDASGSLFKFSPASPVSISKEQLDTGAVINLSKSTLAGTGGVGNEIVSGNNGGGVGWSMYNRPFQMTVQKTSDTQVKLVLLVTNISGYINGADETGDANALLDKIEAY